MFAKNPQRDPSLITVYFWFRFTDDLDTDQETDRLLGQHRSDEGGFFRDEKVRRLLSHTSLLWCWAFSLESVNPLGLYLTLIGSVNNGPAETWVNIGSCGSPHLCAFVRDEVDIFLHNVI